MIIADVMNQNKGKAVWICGVCQCSAQYVYIVPHVYGMAHIGFPNTHGTTFCSIRVYLRILSYISLQNL